MKLPGTNIPYPNAIPMHNVRKDKIIPIITATIIHLDFVLFFSPPFLFLSEPWPELDIVGNLTMLTDGTEMLL